MIDQINIQNFRCFASLQVAGLRRINVVVGRNASGKTSFLESLFLSAGASPQNVVFQLRPLRHLGTKIEIAADAASYRSLWDDLFHWFNSERTISIEVIGTENDSRALRAYYADASSQLLPLGNQPVINPAIPQQIIFEWKRGDHPPAIVKPVITGRGLTFEGASAEYFPMLLFSPHSPDSPEEHAKRFSELSKIGEIGPIERGLNSEFPFVEALSIEYFSNSPAVFASVGNGRKMPVGLLSDGINKLMGILIGMSTYKNGMILIDQIEDGFYYDRLESIWKLIYRFAVSNQCQVFATTHSQECLHAMLPVLEQNAHDFCLLRTERENGFNKVAQFDGQQLFSALARNGQVR